MIRPDDEDKPFVGRWNTLVRVLLVESSVKLVARTAMDYADLYDGTGVHTGNVRMALNTGYSDKTIRTGWATLRILGMVERVAWSSSGKRKADEYDLIIPDNWANIPMLGPRERQFRCVQCDKYFMPSNSSMVFRDDGHVGWQVWKMVFCPEPRKRKGAKAAKAPESCYDQWRAQNGGVDAWRNQGDGGAWKLFRQARGDDW